MSLLRRRREAESSGPCCWVVNGNCDDGPMCGEHLRSVAEVARAQGREGFHSPVGWDGAGLPGWGAIDTNRPDSATPTGFEDRRWGG